MDTTKLTREEALRRWNASKENKRKSLCFFINRITEKRKRITNSCIHYQKQEFVINRHDSFIFKRLQKEGDRLFFPTFEY